MSNPLRRHNPVAAYGRVLRGVLAFVLTLFAASAAFAQPLSQNQGPNLGTWIIGNIDLQLAASGGAGNGTYVWSVLSGVLPPGVSLRTDVPSYYPANANAGLIGVATTPGVYNFTLHVTSGGQSNDRAYTWKISGLTDRDPGIPEGFIGQGYSFQFSALNNAGPVTWTPTSALPPGLALASNGVLSGIPTTAGFFNVNFKIDDGVDVTFHGRGLSIYAVDITTPGALPDATQGADYSTAITAVGGAGGYTFAGCPGNTVGTNCVFGFSFLPNGLSMDSTGAISGTVNAGPGKYTFTITATDTNQVSYSKLMSLDVIGDPPSLPNINLYGNIFDDCTLGLTCSLGLSVGSGGSGPFAWSAIGLPPGLSIRTGDGGNATGFVTPGDGQIWGIPTAFGTYNVQVTVTDAQGVSATNTFPLHVSPMWMSNSFVNGTVGVPYSSKLRVVGGSLPYTVVLKNGTLPAGLAFDPTTFTLSGTPLENGQFNYSFNPLFIFTDAAGNTFEHHSYFGIAAGPSSTIVINSGNNLGTRTLNAFFSQQLSACCLPSFVWSVVGGALPPGVTLSIDGILSGTPSAEGTFTFLLQAADPANAANVGLRQFSLTITALSPSVAPFTLPFGNVGTPYSTSLAGAGVSGLTWNITDQTYPPPGFTLDSATGVFHGTPQSTGQYFFSVDISDGAGRLVTRSFAISIYAFGTVPPLNLNIGSTIGPRAVGVLTQQLTTTGGLAPYHYSLTPGASVIPGMRVQDGQPLPTGFTVTGGFIGVIADPGTYHTSIRVTDSLGAIFDRPLTIIVTTISQLSQSSLPRAAVGVPYTFQLTPFGGSGNFAWALNNSAPPAGLTLSSSGQIAGTPTTPGTPGFNVTLTDLGSSETFTAFYSLIVDPFPITTAGALPLATVGTPYSEALTAPGCGVGCTWVLTNGTNLQGLTLSSGGVLSGTPTGTFFSSFNVTVTGSAGSTTKLFSLQIQSNLIQALVITTTSFGPTTVGTLFGNQVSVFGGAPPYSWSIQDGALPTGLSLEPLGETAGNFAPGFAQLAGRAMQAGLFNFTLKVTDSLGATATRAFTWNISRVAFQYFTLPITGTPLINNPLVYNTPYSQPLLAIGGTGSYSWVNTTSMPPGLALDVNTGVVSGAPLYSGSLSTTIQATDDVGNVTLASISFNASSGTAITLGFNSGPNLGNFQQGFATSFNVTPTGGTAPYSVTALTPLPPGFSFESGDSLLSGFATGSFIVAAVPLATGPLSFTLQAQDSVGNIGVRAFTLTVAPFTRFSSGTLLDGSVGVAYSQSIVAWDNSGPVTWSVSPTSGLPPGISVSAGGVISGTPTAAGTFSFVLNQTDSSGIIIGFGYTLRISQIAIADPLVLPQTAIVGQPFNYAFTGAGGGSPIWSATGLPAGLTMSALGVITGTPATAGTFTVIVTATDGVVPISRRYTLFSRLPNPTQLDVNIVTTALSDTTVGQSTSFTLNNTGGRPPYHWSVAAGALPPGMQLIVVDGSLANFTAGSTLLAGAPTAAGLYAFDLVVTDTAGASARRTYTLNVSPMNILATGPLRAATTGVAYSEQFTTVGGIPPYSYTYGPVSVTQDPLPPGVALSAAGLLSGTPTSTGNYTFALHAQDAAGHTFTRNTTLTVNDPSGLRVNSVNPADAWVGRGRAALTLQTSGVSTYAWSLVGGAMPPGVTVIQLDAVTTGLAGAPTTPGLYAFTLRATDTVNPSIVADHQFTYRVAPMQVVSPPLELVTVLALPSGQIGAPYSFTFKLAGGVPPYSFSESPFNPLPPGLSFSGATLTGIPQAVGNYTIAPIIVDSGGHTINSVAMNLVVTPTGVAPPLVFAGISSVFFNGSVGVPYVGPLVEIPRIIRGGMPPFSWSLANGTTLPPGLVLLPGGNGLSNLIGGIPTAAGDYTFSLTVTDAAGQVLTVDLAQTISSLAMSPDGLLPPATVGTFYSKSLVASGGVPPYTVQACPCPLFTGGSDMPPGLSLTPDGVLSGTPIAPGNFRFLLVLTDSAGHSLQLFYAITVDDLAGEAPGFSLAPRPIQVYYEIGSPAPAPLPINVATTSGTLPFSAIVTGIPGATLSAGNGNTSSSVNLNFDVTGLAAGTYTGVMAAIAPDSANQFDALPVTLTIASPPPCVYSVGPSSTSMAAGGGAGSFTVTTGQGCTWSTTGPPPLVATITAGATGIGTGVVSYSVTPNVGASARTLTFTVRGQTHTVTQFGSSCSFGISPARLTVGAAGGPANIVVSSSLAACAWGANSATLNPLPLNGVGNAIVTVTIPPNLGALPVIHNATIGGKLLTVTQAGAACTVGLSPYTASFTAAGGPGSLDITTPAGCAFDTTSAPSWVAITSGSPGSASGTIVYSVAPNSTTAARVGNLTIGGQTFQVNQAGLACTVTVDTSQLGSPYGPAGGVGIVGITTNGPNCSWTASSGVPWASVNTAGGTGNGSIGVSIQSNASSVAPRNGALTINSQTANIQQAGTACTFSLQSAVGNVPASGGAGAVGVSAPAVCSWPAVSNDPSWLSIASSASGGTGDVQFVAQPNPSGSPRVGTLTIAGLVYTVTEAGAPCAYSLDSTGVAVAAVGAVGSFNFAPLAAGCVPTALSYANWIATETNPGSVSFTVGPNPSASTRVGTIRIGEQNFTLTQTGGACGFSLNAYSALVGPVGDAARNVLGSPSALGCVPTVGTDQPGFISIGALFTPAANIFDLPYGVLPFASITPSVRFGNITFGGQIFLVKQTSY